MPLETGREASGNEFASRLRVSCRYSPDEYAHYYGGLSDWFRSVLQFETGREASGFACFQCETTTDLPMDPYDAHGPLPVRRGDFPSAPAHPPASRREERKMEGGRTGSRRQSGAWIGASTLSGVPIKTWYMRRAQIAREIEVKHSQIAIKVKKMARHNADADRIRSSLLKCDSETPEVCELRASLQCELGIVQALTEQTRR